ncbi:unnamed protein product [Vicia faba]|uniref:Uncharacterized protein n=1 Tax=Vicia faba TaxID=3906 RepID=A0AAV1ACR1_VICFA|nr:unnamed protein product [Vicia faba]
MAEQSEHSGVQQQEEEQFVSALYLELLEVKHDEMKAHTEAANDKPDSIKFFDADETMNVDSVGSFFSLPTDTGDVGPMTDQVEMRKFDA